MIVFRFLQPRDDVAFVPPSDSFGLLPMDNALPLREIVPVVSSEVVVSNASVPTTLSVPSVVHSDASSRPVRSNRGVSYDSRLQSFDRTRLPAGSVNYTSFGDDDDDDGYIVPKRTVPLSLSQVKYISSLSIEGGCPKSHVALFPAVLGSKLVASRIRTFGGGCCSQA